MAQPCRYFGQFGLAPASMHRQHAAMLRNLMLTLLAVSGTLGTARADKSLAEAALAFKDRVPAGCIVTGELRDGQVTYSVVGKAEPDGVPPERRAFEIGSITKVITGVLLARTVIEKKARLDSTLAELLGPDFKFADERVGKITLIQLSTHTSGLPRLPGNMGPDPDANPDPYSRYDLAKLKEYLGRVRLKGGPPYDASYSNLGVGLLGEMLALVHGSTWDLLVKEKVTGPLGMKDTMMVPDEDLRKRLSPPYHDKVPGHEWTFRAMAGAGALRSTAADLMIFAQAMIEPEKTPIADAIRDMMQVHASYPDAGGEVGLGIMIGKLDGERDYMHTGGTGGYRTALQVIPSKKSVRIILINNDNLPAEALLRAVREDRKPVVTEEVALTEVELDTYTGVYEMGPGAGFTILRRGASLHARLTGQPFFPVKSMGNDRFRYEVVAAELQFVKEAGAVKSLILFQNGRELPARRKDAPLPTILFPTAAELAAYTGEYELTPKKILTITVKADTMYAQLTGQPALPVFQTKADYFELDVVKAALEFQKDAEGKVTGLTLHQGGKHQAGKR
ncbi:serine hydrolase [Luteolibacter sp. SL250]|uniref:serine hydrolase n=1 Tax=Luteolibacter sp. SL250 TaxID=2995170 RepID=UPI00226E9292|nr:serine hydrolase [Luteolibacter sp. SL250]WAC20837.1 serine hydrolase [Luteolibacter sp. SL250]